MLQAMGDESEPTFFREVVEAFFADTIALIATLQQSLTSPERDIILRMTHTRKGSSMNVGALGIVAICDELQSAGSMADAAGTAASLTRLKSEFAWVHRELSALIPPYSASDFS